MSPSLWSDDRLLLDEQRLPAVDHGPADVHLAVGEREHDPARSWSVVSAETLEAMSGINMASDMTAFAERLQRRGNLNVRAEASPTSTTPPCGGPLSPLGFVYLYSTGRGG